MKRTLKILIALLIIAFTFGGNVLSAAARQYPGSSPTGGNYHPRPQPGHPNYPNGGYYPYTPRDTVAPKIESTLFNGNTLTQTVTGNYGTFTVSLSEPNPLQTDLSLFRTDDRNGYQGQGYYPRYQEYQVTSRSYNYASANYASLYVGTLEEGRYRLDIQSKDYYGNTIKKSIPFTVDTTAPKIDVVYSLYDVVRVRTSDNWGLKSVEIIENNYSYGYGYYNTNSVVFYRKIDTFGQESRIATALSPNASSITVNVTDLAGNVTSAQYDVSSLRQREYERRQSGNTRHQNQNRTYQYQD